MIDQPGELVVSRVHEAGVQAAIREQPRHAHAAGLVKGGEIAGDEDVPIRLKRHGINGVGNARIRIHGAGARIETQIHRAIRVQPHDAVVAVQIQIGKSAGNQYLPVGLHREGINRVGAQRVRVVGADARGERGVQ